MKKNSYAIRGIAFMVASCICIFVVSWAMHSLRNEWYGFAVYVYFFLAFFLFLASAIFSFMKNI